MCHENINKFYFYDIEDTNGQKTDYNIYCYIELMETSLDKEIKNRNKKNYFSLEEINKLIVQISRVFYYMQKLKSTAH